MAGSSVFNNGENGFSVLDRFPVELLNGESGVHRLMHVYAHTCNYVHAKPIVVKLFMRRLGPRQLLKPRSAIVPRRVRWAGRRRPARPLTSCYFSRTDRQEPVPTECILS